MAVLLIHSGPQPLRLVKMHIETQNERGKKKEIRYQGTV